VLSLPPVQGEDISATFNVAEALRHLIAETPVPDIRNLDYNIFSRFALPSFTLSGSLSAYHNAFMALHNFPDTYYALRGSISDALHRDQQNQGEDFFAKFKQFFLTWQPSDNAAVVGIHQPVKLYYVNQDTEKEVRTRIVVTYNDNSTATLLGVDEQDSRLAAWRVLEVNCSPVHFPNAENVSHFSIRLETLAGVALTHRRTYYVSHRDNQNFFLFRNSLGVFDSISFSNPQSVSVNTSKEYDGESKMAQMPSSEQIETHYPAVLNDAWRRYYRDFLMSAEIYRVAGDTLQRVSMQSDSLAPINSGSRAHLIEFLISNAYIDEYIHQ
ncbi:MAG: hypothetical protein ACOCX0_06685, partial [Bacteroidota bacterium]